MAVALCELCTWGWMGDVIGTAGEGQDGDDGHDGHDGGAPLSCWVERSKPRYRGPSSLIFYNVFWYRFEATRMGSNSFEQGRAGQFSSTCESQQSSLGGGESEPTYT